MRLAVHAPGHALDRAEQIDEDRDRRDRAVGLDRLFEQHGRPALGEQPRLDLGHFEDGRNGFGNPHQPSGFFQAIEEIAQRRISHDPYIERPARAANRAMGESNRIYSTKNSGQLGHQFNAQLKSDINILIYP